MPSETAEWPAWTGHAATETALICGKCRGDLAFVGKLPAVRFLPLLQVYKCIPCNQIVTVRP